MSAPSRGFVLSALLIFGLILPGLILAAPAMRELVVVQPDGVEVVVRVMGDEQFVVWETLDRYTIVKDSDGYWCYATRSESGGLVASETRAQEKPPASLAPRLRPAVSPRVAAANRSVLIPKIESAQIRSNTGTLDCVVILMNFNDTTPAFNAARFGGPPLFTPLRWIVGHGWARDLCLTGRRIDAREAHRIGLVSRVVDPKQLLDQALATCNQILEAPAHTLASVKQYLIGNVDKNFEDSFAVEHDEVFKKFIGK